MFDFPNTPVSGQIVTAPNGATWRWDGSKWTATATSISPPSPATALPLMNGTAAVGASSLYSRGDHVHPSDTSRAAASALNNYLPLAGGTVTGPLLLSQNPTQASGAATKGYSDGTYVFKSGDTMTGALNVSNGRVVSYSNGNNPSFSVWDTSVGAAAGMFYWGSSGLSFGPMDQYGDAQAGWIRMNQNGINYTTWGANFHALTWDGTAITYRLNGNAMGCLVKSVNASGGIAQIVEMDLDSNDPSIYFWYNNSNYVWSHTNWSDRRLKDNLSPAAVDALALVNKIGVYAADMRNPLNAEAPRVHWDCSLVADEVGALIPNAWHHGRGDNYDGLRELPLIATLWRAVQQLSAEVDQLKSLIAESRS